MKMIIHLIPIYSVIFLNACYSFYSPKKACVDDDKYLMPKLILDSDSYKIYDIISDRFTKENIPERILVPTTISGPKLPRKDYNSIKLKFENLDSFMLDRLGDSSIQMLDTAKIINKNWVCIKNCEIKDIYKYNKIFSPRFSDVVAWDIFRKRYGVNQGEIDFTNIIYNEKKSKAFVYVIHEIGPSGYAGFYFYLEIINGEWKILKSEMSWIA